MRGRRGGWYLDGDFWGGEYDCLRGDGVKLVWGGFGFIGRVGRGVGGLDHSSFLLKGVRGVNVRAPALKGDKRH